MGVNLPVVVDDGVESMSHGEDRALPEGDTNRRLNEVIGLEVDGGSRLVENEDSRPFEHRPREADQLTLPNAEADTTSPHHTTPHEAAQLIGTNCGQ